jgi:hypothetical protein
LFRRRDRLLALFGRDIAAARHQVAASGYRYGSTPSTSDGSAEVLRVGYRRSLPVLSDAL